MVLHSPPWPRLEDKCIWISAWAGGACASSWSWWGRGGVGRRRGPCPATGGRRSRSGSCRRRPAGGRPSSRPAPGSACSGPSVTPSGSGSGTGWSTRPGPSSPGTGPSSCSWQWWWGYPQARVQLTCTDSRSEQQRGPQSWSPSGRSCPASRAGGPRYLAWCSEREGSSPRHWPCHCTGWTYQEKLSGYYNTTTLGQIDFQWNHLKYLVLDDFSLNASIVNLEHVQKSHKQISKENCHLISYLDVERYIRIQINGCWKYQGQAGGTLKRNLNVKRNMMWSSAGEWEMWKVRPLVLAVLLPQSPLHHIINTFRTGNTPTLCHQATHSLPINYHQSLNDNPDCFMSMLILVFTLCLPGDSEYSVEFYELQELQRLVVTEVEGFHTHSNGLRDSISRV